MQKATATRVVLAIGVSVSAWVAFVALVAPFGVSPALFAAFVVGGLTSLAAVVLAALKPRQIPSLVLASLVAAAHLAIWSWIALIGLNGGL